MMVSEACSNASHTHTPNTSPSTLPGLHLQGILPNVILHFLGTEQLTKDLMCPTRRILRHRPHVFGISTRTPRCWTEASGRQTTGFLEVQELHAAQLGGVDLR